MGNYQIAVLAGDGIGPEVTATAQAVLTEIGKKYRHKFSFKPALVGAAAIEAENDPLPASTIEICRESQAILFGAVGDPKYDIDPSLKVRPEQGLLKLRKTFDLFANIRPVQLFPEAAKNSPIKAEKLAAVDIVFFRELTGGIYFGEPRGRTEAGDKAFDTCLYSRTEIIRIAKLAFETAARRRKKVTMVDKANVLATSRLWREVTTEVARDYPAVKLDFLYVDNASMQLILNPAQFDVILTENMFGDILTDEASVLAGSLGMLPSASIGDSTGMYEPIHGSYPQAKGQDIANPIGSILSAAMLLEYSFKLTKEAEAIRKAVGKVLAKQQGTVDIFPTKPVGTKKFTELVLAEIV